MIGLGIKQGERKIDLQIEHLELHMPTQAVEETNIEQQTKTVKANAASIRTTLKKLVTRTKKMPIEAVNATQSTNKGDKTTSKEQQMIVGKLQQLIVVLQELPVALRKKLPGYIYPSKDVLLADEKLKITAKQKLIKQQATLSSDK